MMNVMYTATICSKNGDKYYTGTVQLEWENRFYNDVKFYDRMQKCEYNKSVQIQSSDRNTNIKWLIVDYGMFM